MTNNTTNNRSTWKLILLLCIVALPFAIAQLLYHGGYRPKQSLNHGTFINPPAQFTDVALQQLNPKKTLPKDKWLLVYLVPKQCDRQCQLMLRQIHGVQQAMGKESKRVSYLLVLQHDDAALVKKNRLIPVFRVLPTGQRWLTTTLKQSNKDFAKGGVLIVDPHHHIVLHYTAPVTPKHIFKDLKHLLQYSHIG